MPFTTTEFPSYIGNRLIHLELDFDVVELDVEFKLLFSTLTDIIPLYIPFIIILINILINYTNKEFFLFS